MTIANTVISQDNASLDTMGTDQLLDLFTLENQKKGESSAGTTRARNQSEDRKETTKSIIEGLGELWSEEQYETEYDIETFMKSLASKST